MIEVTEVYYSLGSYYISRSYYFDNNMQANFFDSYTPRGSTNGNKRA